MNGGSGALAYLRVNGERVGEGRYVTAWRWGGATQEVVFTFDAPPSVTSVEIEFANDGEGGDNSFHIHEMSINGVAVTAAESTLLAPWGTSSGSWDLWFNARVVYDVTQRPDIFEPPPPPPPNEIVGTDGADVLDGTSGADILAGGAGADTFRFAARGGQDTITDFNAAEGDRIDLSGAGVANMGQLQITAANGLRTVTLADGTAIAVRGDGTPAADWFVFSGDGNTGSKSVITLAASANTAGGVGALVYLRVNGVRVGEGQYVTVDRWSGQPPQELTFTFDTPAVVRSIEIEFANDGEGGGDRNFFIHGLTANGVALTEEESRLVTSWGTDDGSWSLWYNARVAYDMTDREDIFTPIAGLEINGTDAAEALGGTAGADTMNGAGGDDTLTGAEGRDILDGGAGNDVLNGGTSADTMTGGLGDDVYAVDHVGDLVNEAAGEGHDRVEAGVAHTLGAAVEDLALTGAADIDGTGNALDNVITGNAGANRLTGGAGNDTLGGSVNGVHKVDTLLGGLGDDTYLVHNATDIVAEAAGEGTDTVRSAVTWTLGGHVEHLELTGGGHLTGNGNGLDNRITGNGGHNRLNGLEGTDTLTGGGGSDTLDGGTGDDRLTGGGGADTFRILRGGGNDTVTDFTYAEGDRIDLTGSGITRFDQLQMQANGDGTGVTVSLDDGTSITLLGAGAVDDMWFRFDMTGRGGDGAGTQFMTWEGISLPSYWGGNYLTADADAAFDQMKDTGANSTAIIPSFFMETKHSNTMGLLPYRSETMENTRAAIADAHARGISVMLKPHVETQDDTWRAEIAPTDPDLWFANYKAMMVSYAQLAEETGVELFCVGTEMKSMTQPQYTAKWVDLIDAVRAVYSGAVTYSATDTESQTVGFWDKLDYIGVNPYAPMTNGNDPTVQDLIDGWIKPSTVQYTNEYHQGRSLVQAYKDLSEQHGKKVIFTEIGYRSMDGANKDPGVFGGGGTVDLQEQVDCYEALFQVMTAHGGQWLDGAFLWSYHPFADPTQHVGPLDYTTQGKPADQVITNWYNNAQHGAGLTLTGTVVGERVDGGFHNDVLNGAGGSDTVWGGAGHDTLVGGADSNAPLTRTTVTVKALGDITGGVGPLVHLRVNGQRVGEGQTVTASRTGGDAPQTLTFQFDNTGLVDSLEVEFANDASVGGVDRNLYIKGIDVNGYTLKAEEATLLTEWGQEMAGTWDIWFNARLIHDTTDRPELFIGSTSDDDRLDGGLGDDSLIGGAGADTLIGGAGNDTLQGGLDADRFVFGSGSGNDVITDFAAGSGDAIALSTVMNGTTLGGFADIQAAMVTSGADTILNLGAGNTLRIVGVTAGQFTAADFLLV